MVYHYYKLPSITIIKKLYEITTNDNAIGNFWWFVFDLVGMDKNKTRHKQLISNGSKYWWE